MRRSWTKWLVWGGATLAFFWCHRGRARARRSPGTWPSTSSATSPSPTTSCTARSSTSGRRSKALEPFFPPRTDVLVQTYVYDHGQIYCRYAPGFPMLLAGWIGVLGADRAHYLNPTLYLGLLAVAVAFQWRLFRSLWRAMVGTALIALFPTMMHLWGSTLTRDLSAHLFALIGLFILLPVRGRPISPRRSSLQAWRSASRGDPPRRRPLPRAGRVYAGAALVAAADAARSGDGARPRRHGAAASSSVRRPFWPTTGLPPAIRSSPPRAWSCPSSRSCRRRSPSRRHTAAPPAAAAPADAGDKVGYPSPGWRGGTYEQVQGGGLRLGHLATTLPGNWRLTMRAYTPLLFGAAVWGVVVAVVMRPMLAAAAVPYAVVAFLFFSCWPRPDFRYLIGVFVFLPMLVVEGTIGTLDLIRVAWRQRRREVARGLAILAAALFLLGALQWSPVTAPGQPVRAYLPRDHPDRRDRGGAGRGVARPPDRRPRRTGPDAGVGVVQGVGRAGPGGAPRTVPARPDARGARQHAAPAGAELGGDHGRGGRTPRREHRVLRGNRATRST